MILAILIISVIALLIYEIYIIASFFEGDYNSKSIFKKDLIPFYKLWRSVKEKFDKLGD